MIRSVKIAEIKWNYVLPGFDPVEALGALGRDGLCVRRLGKKREVWRVERQGDVFYVKLFSASGLTKKRREADAIDRLAKLGVPVPVLVARGYGGGGAVLITREVEGSRVLKDYFLTTFKGLSRRAQRKAAQSFAAFVRLLHDKGVFHKDPHMGNMLVVEGDDGALDFCLLDLGEVKFEGKVMFADRAANLELINLNFMADVEPSFKYLFFKSYAENLLDDKATLKSAIEKVELATLARASKIWKKKAQQSMTGGKLFAEYTEGSFEVHLKKLWHESGAIDELIKDPDSFLESKKAVIFKDGRTVKAAMVKVGDGKKIFLKRYNVKGSVHTLKNMFRTSRASRVWLRSYGGELRGLLMPEPIAFIEERKKGRVLGRSYIITEFIDGALRLSDIAFAKDNGTREGEADVASNAALSYLCGLLFRIGRELRRMHILGWYHGDLKWNNILIKESSELGRPLIFFLDIDGSVVSSELGASEVKKDLLRFIAEIDKFGYGAPESHSFLFGYRSYTLGIRPTKELTGIYKELDA
jgi:tRNA A-37 threonylcarbamoyl transferase component Bud32